MQQRRHSDEEVKVRSRSGSNPSTFQIPPTTDRATRARHNVIGQHLRGIHPCGTGLIVSGLAIPEMVVEIDIDAVIPEDEYRPG